MRTIPDHRFRTVSTGIVFFLVASAGLSTLNRSIFAQRVPSHPATQSAALEPAVAAIVEQLDDTDLAVRDRATAQLKDMGRAGIIPAGIAARSDSPEVRIRARAILRTLPWDAADDPPPIATVLHNFGAQPINEERQVIRWLAQPQNPNHRAAWLAIGRILLSYPDSDVLWECVTQIRLHPSVDLGIPPQQIITMNSPMKVVAARVNLLTRPLLSADLLVQAMKETPESDHPPTNFDELTAIIEDLIKVSRTGHVEQATCDIIRGKIALVPELYRPWLRRELYGLHGNSGHLRGLMEDLLIRPPDLTDPPTLYALGQLERRRGHPFLAAFFDEWAFDAVPHQWKFATDFAVGGEPRARQEIGSFIIDHGWYAQAEHELNEVLKTAPQSDGHDREAVYFLLAKIDARRGDEFMRGTHLRLAVEEMEQHFDPAVLPLYDAKRVAIDNLDNVRAGMRLAFMRAAVKTNDPAAAAEQARKLAKLKPLSDEMLLESWQLLPQSPPDADLQAWFDANYNWRKGLYDRSALSPFEISKFAWMCARCDEHLDEAISMAHEAVDREPSNPACVATLAEVEFHLGHVTEALAAQERASALSPKDPLIQKHLLKYQAAAAKKKAEKVKGDSEAE